MKKLMIAAVIAFSAVLTQAASVAWSTGRIKAPGEGGEGWSTDSITGSDYLATIYFWDSVSDAGDISKALSTITGTSSSTISSKALKGTTSDFAAMDKTYYAQVIVTKGDSTLTSDVASFVYATGDLDTPDINFYSGTGFKETFSGDTGAFSSGWQSVPEPTSGLLLLLGVAGLALRRRRA